jgi:phenylalanyl-tRNA synthetase beta chain
MEYSLYRLNKCANLNKINLSDIVDKLNLIGFEVDDIFNERLLTNKFINNIRLLIEIPSNRQDLLNEQLFLKELATIFLFEVYELWKTLKINYSFLFSETSGLYSNLPVSLISSNLGNILIYKFNLENCYFEKSSSWIQQKVLDSGLTVENNLNDLLNLIVLEYGTTLTSSVFDDSQNQLFVKRLQVVEIIQLGDKIETLQPGTIVLQDQKNVVLSILGKLSFIEQSSDSLSLEAAFYDIYENSLNLKTINTNLSYKHLRKSFENYFIKSFHRLFTLLEIYNPDLVVSSVFTNINSDVNLVNTNILKVEKNLFRQILGVAEFDYGIFKKASLSLIGETAKTFYFSISTFRKDLTRDIDLIEEYSRFIGYKNFHQILPTKHTTYTAKKLESYPFIRDFFINSGFSEVFSNTLVEKVSIKPFEVNIKNPLNSEVNTLRSSLFPRLFDIFELNVKSGFNNNNFFEIGRVFKVVENKVIEQDKLSGIFQSDLFFKDNIGKSTDWFIVKGFFESFLNMFGYNDIELEPLVNKIHYFHLGRSVQFKINNRIIGTFGEVNPGLKDFRSYKKPVYMFEFNLVHLKSWRLKTPISPYLESSKYPSITRDLSFSINKSQSLSNLKCQVLKISENLKAVDFFDVYFEENITNTVNLGLRLEFQSSGRTLNTVEIEDQIISIQKLLAEQFLVDFK